MKNIFRFLMAVAVLFTASCTKEDISSSIAGGEVEVTFTANLPELGTRAYADGAKATTLRYYVYDGDNYLSGISSESLPEKKVTLTNGKAVVTLPLLKGMTYNIIFWADNGSDIYSIDPATKVLTVDYTGVMSNDDSRDAFYKYLTNVDPTDATKIKEQAKVTLTRPFGQLNAATNDFEAVRNNLVTLTTSSLKVKTFSKLNLETGVATDAVDVTFDATAMPCMLTTGEEILMANYKYLSMNYLLPGTVDAEFTFKGTRNNGSEIVFTGTKYSAVPLKANYRTNILGALLTKPTDFEVKIEADFDVPAEEVDVWDGKTVTPPAYDADSKTYTVTNGAELAWIAAVVNATTPYSTTLFDNKYVYLANDIDLNNEEWIPIGDDRSQRTEFHGIFDGQGHTVKNVKITKKTDRDDDNKSSYGLFGNLKGTVKNLTVENVSISGAPKFIGALVGRMNDGLIENCHVKNSNVTCNNWTIGGLVGQLNNGKISGCSVEKTTVTGYAAVAAIAGIALNKGERTIENCTVKECTLVQNGSFGYGDYDKMFGAIVGALYSGELTVNLVNCNIEQTTIKGEPSNVLCGHISNGDTLLINGVCLTIVDGYTALFKNDEGDYCLLNKQSLIDWHAFLAASPTRNPYNCNVKMLADIDADGWTWNSLWITPAANNLTGLQFDGQNHTISNLNIAGEGMFSASLAGMAFKNLTINGVEVEVASTGHNAAVFAGSAYSSVSFENVAVKNATVNGPCNTGIFVGGTNEPNNLVVSFKNCSVETSAVTAAGKNGQDPTGASGFVGKAYGSTKLVFEGTNSIDDATTITNHNGLVGGKAYGYTIWANGGWAGTGVSDELVSWGGLSYVSDAAALTEALKNGLSVVLDADIDFGSTQLAITGENQVVDLGGHTLTTNMTHGGIALKNGASIVNGTIEHTSTVAAIKAFNVGSIENVTIKATCATADKTITGIAVQQGGHVGTIKNVTINGVSQGIEVGYQATVGLIENAVVNENNNGTAKGIGLVINAGKVGKAKNCTFKGETYGVTMHLKGVFAVGLELENCTVEGTTASIIAWDEKGASNTSGSLVLTYDAATTLTGPFVWDFEDECKSVVTLNRPE